MGGMGSPPRVLVVEDDVAIRDAVVVALADAGLVTHAVGDAIAARRAVAGFCPDLVVLDVRLPGGDQEGFAVGRFVRDRGETPVLYLTAADGEADRLAGFAAGGDDYVVKPFLLSELVARVRAVLRRSGRLRSETLAVADLVVDELGRTATRAGTTLALTTTEFTVLVTLVRHRGMVLSKDQLLELVWGWEVEDPNVVERQISALRRKLEALGPRLIRTVRGAGYVLRP